ncbi:MAG: L-threonylcarbamoyladenylate synthase [Myxococcota bacterium]
MSAVAREGAHDPIPTAVARVCAGGLVAFATETVYGLGADARSVEGLARLLAWKGRAARQPVSVLVSGLPAAQALGVRLTPGARRLAAAFWPGPLTLVLRGARGLAPGVCREDGALGLRCSSHPLARALTLALERAGAGPLTATSLNKTGEPPASSAASARRLCTGASAPLLVEGAEAFAEAPSSVVDLTGAEPVVLRAGPIESQSLLSALTGQALP